MNTKHSLAAQEFIKDLPQAKWHEETLWNVRKKRDVIAKEIPEWEELRNTGDKIKLHTLAHLGYYLELFEKNAKANGINIHWAETAEEHNEIVLEILQKHHATSIVKSKSMLTEECHLNSHLEKHGVEVVDTDLGEFIIQLNHQAPSHIVVPAIHLKREEVGKIFERQLGTEPNNSDPNYLVNTARNYIRTKFLKAKVGITGVNFAIAETGEIVVCTNEGNADMGTSIPNVHIACMGIEKVIPDYDSLAVFIRLLARSATGQPITIYTSHFKKPRENCEMHIVLVDNGRSKSFAQHTQKNEMTNVNTNSIPHTTAINDIDPFKCIRCGACMNTCPVYRRSGGYSYTYFIPGPIGINLGMMHAPEKYYDNLSACSLCYSCSDVCPVKIPLAEHIYSHRQKATAKNLGSFAKKMISKSLKIILGNKMLFSFAIRFGKIINYVPKSILRQNAWGKSREMPRIARESFQEMWKKNKIQNKSY